MQEMEALCLRDHNFTTHISIWLNPKGAAGVSPYHELVSTPGTAGARDGRRDRPGQSSFRQASWPGNP
jgi:hypothetical protein